MLLALVVLPYLGWYIDQQQWDQLRDLLGRFRQLVPNVPIPVDPNPPDPQTLLRLAKALDVFDPHSTGRVSPLPGGSWRRRSRGRCRMSRRRERCCARRRG